MRATNGALSVHLLTDGRWEIPANRVFRGASERVDINGTKKCINNEGWYEGAPVPMQITRMLASQIRTRNIFGQVMQGNNNAEYHLTGRILYFRGEYDVNYADVTGAVIGGLIGAAIASAAATSEGQIRIQITDLKVSDRRGRLLAKLPDINRKFAGDYQADSDCGNIYSHVNRALGKAIGDWLPSLDTAARHGFQHKKQHPVASPASARPRTRANTPPPPATRAATLTEQKNNRCYQGLVFKGTTCASPCNPACSRGEVCTQSGKCLPAR